MDKTGRIKINKYAGLIRTVLLTFCIIVAVIVTIVMFKVYDPNRNALGALSSVCMDVICMIILFIFICSFAFGSYETNRTTKLFAVLLVATKWALFMDFLNWAFDGALEFGKLTFWFTIGSLCMGSILAGIFCLYIYIYLLDAHNFTKMRISAYVCAILNLASFVLTFVLAITGTAFTFVDGHYETGVLYQAVMVIPILTILYIAVFVLCNQKIIGWHDVLAVAGYICFMVAGAFIEEAYRIGTTFVSVAIADIYIFIMVQNEIIAQEKRNVLEWIKRSNTDELTGFFNRHAYEADVAEIESSVISENFVYVSADVNSLKIVNDTIGHNGGDELIVGAAQCLEKAFGAYGKLYRTGGDEFIALLNMDAEAFTVACKQIESLTNNWRGKNVQGLALSCGYVTRREEPEMSLKQMAVLADRRMYDAKDEYYKRTGIERRKK